MKRLIELALVLFTVMLIASSCTTETKTFTLSGEWIVVGSGTPDEKQQVMNAQHTSVVITHAVDEDEGNSDNSILATGSFDDGEVFLEGEIVDRTEVQIEVTRGEEAPMTLRAVLILGANTTFALLDQDNSILGVEDQLMLVEEFRIVEESNDKFSIIGDLSAISDKDLSVARAYIRVGSSNPQEGSFVPNKSNAVLLQDGRFSIEGTASEPLLVEVWVKSLVDVYLGSVHAVVEPGAEITISPSKSSSSFAPGNKTAELMANSKIEDSVHGEVIEIWQHNKGYLDKMSEYAHSIDMVEQKATTDTSKRPSVVYTEMKAIQNTVLTPIALNLEKPMLMLLAMEVGARSH